MKNWAVPLLSSAYLRDAANFSQDVDVMREVDGANLVSDIVRTLAADEEVGSQISLPAWLQPGELFTFADYENELLPLFAVERSDFDAAVERGKQFLDAVKDVGIKTYLDEE